MKDLNSLINEGKPLSGYINEALPRAAIAAAAAGAAAGAASARRRSSSSSSYSSSFEKKRDTKKTPDNYLCFRLKEGKKLPLKLKAKMLVSSTIEQIGEYNNMYINLENKPEKVVKAIRSLGAINQNDFSGIWVGFSPKWEYANNLKSQYEGDMKNAVKELYDLEKSEESGNYYGILKPEIDFTKLADIFEKIYK